MNPKIPSPLASYSSSGFALVILQWILLTRYQVTIPDDVAVAIVALLGNVIHSIREAGIIAAWLARRRAAAEVPVNIYRSPAYSGTAGLHVETVHYSDGSSATGTAPLPPLSPDQQAAAEAKPVPTILDIPGLAVPEPLTFKPFA